MPPDAQGNDPANDSGPSEKTPASAEASAFGAVTILNATATGIGASLATDLGITATWEWQAEPGLRFHNDTGADDSLAQAVHQQLAARLDGVVPGGAEVSTRGGAQPARGLKTSSSAAAAMVLAGLHAANQAPSHNEVIALAIDAAVQAGVTLTGAYDDQVATVLGGCHLTLNPARRILQPLPIQPWHVAVWMPDEHIAKDLVKNLDVRPAMAGARRVVLLAQAGDLPGAMTENGRTFHRLYEAAGLPVTDEPTQVALDAGALGAGLSGTGPAVAALFEHPVDLAVVAGGTWTWQKAVDRRPSAVRA